jgi:hypothetical protein
LHSVDEIIFLAALVEEDYVPNQDSFDVTKFLAYLDPDPDRAAKEYNVLRRAVIRYLQNHGSWSPEEHTSEHLVKV